MRVLVTRPAEDAQPLVADLQALGHRTLVEPMLSISPRADAEIDLGDVQALLITSANGARSFAALSDRRDLPVLAVGEASAAAARAAGFSRVESADGDARALARLARRRLVPSGGVLLHPAGTVTAGHLKEDLESSGFVVRRVSLYDAVPSRALSGPTASALERGDIDAVLFFSPRTADTFVTLVRQAGLDDACRDVAAVCLSDAVADRAAALQWRDVRTAKQPERAALLEVLRGEADRPQDSHR